MYLSLFKFQQISTAEKPGFRNSRNGIPLIPWLGCPDFDKSKILSLPSNTLCTVLKESREYKQGLNIFKVSLSVCVFIFCIFNMVCKAMILPFIKRGWQRNEIKFLLEKGRIDHSPCRAIQCSKVGIQCYFRSLNIFNHIGLCRYGTGHKSVMHFSGKTAE